MSSLVLSNRPDECVLYMAMQTRIAGEKRRLTDLRGVQTPVKGTSLGTSPYFYSSPAR